MPDNKEKYSKISVLPQLNNAKNVNRLVAMFNKESRLKKVLIENRRNISEIDSNTHFPDYINLKRFWIDEIPATLLTYNRDSSNEKIKKFISPLSEDWIVLQLHGGGYVNAFKRQYHNMAGFYAEAGRGVQVLSIDYRVAPEYTHPAALEDAVRAYKWLLDAAYEPSNIIFAGDSAGGGLAIALCAYLRDNGYPLPAGILALSPWTDVTASGVSYDEHFEDDPVFGGTRESLIYNNPYVADSDQRDPYLSPLFGDFKEFPPMLVQVGEREMLLSDSIELIEKAKSDGVDVTFSIYPDMFHVFQIAGPLLDESKKAWNEISRFFQKLERIEK